MEPQQDWVTKDCMGAWKLEKGEVSESGSDVGTEKDEVVGKAWEEFGRRDVLGSFEGGLYGTFADNTTTDVETMLEEDLLGTFDFLL